jgi:Asp-tRNA(Asn)/Glu-tRNA(Gln) amidotransferase C subunit
LDENEDEDDYEDFVHWARKQGVKQRSAVLPQIEKLKNDSGIPTLRTNLEKRLFQKAFAVKRAKLDEAFSDFQKRIDLLVAEGIGNQQENLDTLDANQAQLEEKRQAVAEVEQMTNRIRRYMERVQRTHTSEAELPQTFILQSQFREDDRLPDRARNGKRRGERRQGLSGIAPCIRRCRCIGKGRSTGWS